MKQITITILTILITIITIGQDNTNYKVELIKELCSPYSDCCLRYLDNNFQSIVFSSKRYDAKSAVPVANLHYTTLLNGKWNTPVAIDTLCKGCNNAILSVDNKRNVLFFMKCPFLTKTDTGCDIYYAFMQGDLMGESIRLDIETPEIQEVNVIGHPFFYNDHDVLLFSALDWPGGFGGIDIWYSIYNRIEDTWGKPQNLGPEINTEKDENFPYVQDDGTLYFGSSGHIGLGGYDIFKAKQVGKTSWTKVENMGEPINSNANDYAIVFRGSTNAGFLSSNRPGGIGDDDIYEFSATDIAPSSFVTTSTVDSQEVKSLLAIFNKEQCTANKKSLKITQVRFSVNPISEEFTLEFKCNLNTDLMVRIHNNLGLLVTEETVTAKNGITTKSYNFNTGSGIYYVQILYKCKPLFIEKVIVE